MPYSVRHPRSSSLSERIGWLPPRIAILIALLVGVRGEAQENAAQENAPQPKTIVLVAGTMAKQDVPGHHDYLAGCQCLQVLLQRIPGIHTRLIRDGWPAEDSQWKDAASVVFYTDGGGKQAFLQSPARVQRIQQLADAGVGFVFLHQAVDFPAEHQQPALGWLGGIYLQGRSGRGHWPSTHVDFPEHPITRGVTPWKVNDGWLNELEFVAGLQGVTPLVWSGKVYAGSRSGREADVVGWAYERSNHGRTFGFTGLDAHSAWSLPGMRQLVLNGVLWSAKVEIPPQGAPCDIAETDLAAMITPREPKPVKKK